MSEKNEPILIIKSEDLKDPKKLAFVKAIVGSEDKDGYILYGDVGGLGLLMARWDDCHQVIDSWVDGGLQIKISDIKLEPRLLIGENVVVEGEEVGDNEIGKVISCETRRGCDVYWLGIEDYGQELYGKKFIKPSLQWLKENFEVIE